MKNKLIFKNNIILIMLMLILISILTITLFILATNNYFTLNKNIEGYTGLSLDAKINCGINPSHINYDGSYLDVNRGSCAGTFSSNDPMLKRCVDIVPAPIGTLRANIAMAVATATSGDITKTLNTLQLNKGTECE